MSGDATNAPAAWQGVIRRYAAHLPVDDSTPVVSLLEGNTPLIRADRLAREIGGDISIVTLELLPLSVDVEQGIKISALALETRPVVEPLARRVVVVPHMPLADVGRFDAGGLKIFGEKPGTWRNRSLVIDDLVPMHVLAGENGGAAGGAKRCGDEGVGQMRTLSSHAVEVRRFEKLWAVRVEPEKVVPVVVTQNEDDISEHRLGVCCMAKQKQRDDGQAKRLAKAGGCWESSCDETHSASIPGRRHRENPERAGCWFACQGGLQ